jgi:hypothetical protein
MGSLIINLIAGALGGNAAGKSFKDPDLGTVGNSIAGILGGGLAVGSQRFLGCQLREILRWE